MFVLKRIVGWAYYYEYYAGSTFVHQGEVFANCDDDHKNAKFYTSEARAENAAIALKKKCGYSWEVEEFPQLKGE